MRYNNRVFDARLTPWLCMCSLVWGCASSPKTTPSATPASKPQATAKAGSAPSDERAPSNLARAQASDPASHGEPSSATLGAAVSAATVDEPLWELPVVETLVEQAIARNELPGCVVVIGTDESVLYRRAFGQRSLDPPEPMTVETLFDLASVTKVMATTPSLMKLEAQGKLDVDAPVARYLPRFAAAGKGAVTVRHLLTHTSGLPRVNPLQHYDDGPTAAFRRIYAAQLEHPVGEVFNYSDVGFILLGHLVEKLSGQPLHAFAEQQLAAPLGLQRTRFLPEEDEIPRAAPTEERDELPIRGVVDDPRAYRLGGVSGNAGLFSDARDMTKLAQLWLNLGEIDGTRVFDGNAVERWTAPHRAGHARRTLGWDSQSGYAKGRGKLMSERTYGHSGYTGVSLWLDPERKLFVLLLSNRVHVGRGATIYPLASSIADIAVHKLDVERAARATPEVQTGIDVLQAQAFAPLRGRRVVLLTNSSARNADGRRTLDVLRQSRELTLAALWTPEHGLSGRREGHVAGGRYQHLPVHSLFGRKRDPNQTMLHGAEAIVVDLQDVGARFYTYAATVERVLQFASTRNLPVWILDRPNPLGGQIVRGPITEPAFESFVNYHPLPIQHGLTLGELAHLLKRERELTAPLTVVRMEGWRRHMLFSDTGLAWHAPSPNLRRFSQVVLYPAVALIEGTNVSVGRGTDSPFELVGAPYIDAEQLTERLRSFGLPGLSIEPAHFRPRSSRHRGELCHGVRLTLDDPNAFDAARTGLALARSLGTLRPQWDDTRLGKMIAHQDTLDALFSERPLDELTAMWREQAEGFEPRRAAVMLYPDGPALQTEDSVAQAQAPKSDSAQGTL